MSVLMEKEVKLTQALRIENLKRSGCNTYCESVELEA